MIVAVVARYLGRPGDDRRLPECRPGAGQVPGARGGPENRLRESFLSIRYRYEGSFVFSEKIVIFVLRIPGWDG